MSEQFSWVSDLSRGEWLRPMEAEPFGSIRSVVPAGFEAYARVFHPVERDRPRDTKTWSGIDATTHFRDVQNLEQALETQPATWATTAASFGTTMHPEAQYARLVRHDNGQRDDVIAPDGWRYFPPSEGCLDATSLAAACAVLARHTATPAAGIAAVWEGWGGLMSSAGRAHLVLASSRPRRFVAAVRQGVTETIDTIRNIVGTSRNEPELGTGLLAREIATGPRFDLHGGTGRSYVLFEAGASDFADVEWTARAPWVDQAIWAQSPSILWPGDHAWLLATEIDFDSTLVAGTRALVDELVQTPGLEVLPLSTAADLTWQGDAVNRPG